MKYTIDPNDPNVSTTLGQKKEEEVWTLDKLYKSEFTLDSLITTLQVVDLLRKKYPNDDVIQCFEEIVREEACIMFGGTTIKENEYVD